MSYQFIILRLAFSALNFTIGFFTLLKIFEKHNVPLSPLERVYLINLASSYIVISYMITKLIEETHESSISGLIVLRYKPLSYTTILSIFWFALNVSMSCFFREFEEAQGNFSREDNLIQSYCIVLIFLSPLICSMILIFPLNMNRPDDVLGFKLKNEVGIGLMDINTGTCIDEGVKIVGDLNDGDYVKLNNSGEYIPVLQEDVRRFKKVKLYKVFLFFEDDNKSKKLHNNSVAIGYVFGVIGVLSSKPNHLILSLIGLSVVFVILFVMLDKSCISHQTSTMFETIGLFLLFNAILWNNVHLINDKTNLIFKMLTNKFL